MTLEKLKIIEAEFKLAEEQTEHQTENRFKRGHVVFNKAALNV